MAMTTCPECSSEMSELAPACPKCGNPNLTLQKASRRRRLIWVATSIIAVVMLAGGYVVWAAVATSARTDEWTRQVHDIVGASSKTATISASQDLSTVTFATTVKSTCSDDEVSALSAQIIHQLVLAGLGNVSAFITQPIADQQARVQCPQQKAIVFNKAVSDTQVGLAVFLTAIGSPESAMTATDGIRGLDGTQEVTFPASQVGKVSMQYRYDGTNGLSVTIIRESVPIDWGAPFGG